MGAGCAFPEWPADQACVEAEDALLLRSLECDVARDDALARLEALQAATSCREEVLTDPAEVADRLACGQAWLAAPCETVVAEGDDPRWWMDQAENCVRVFTWQGGPRPAAECETLVVEPLTFYGADSVATVALEEASSALDPGCTSVTTRGEAVVGGQAPIAGNLLVTATGFSVDEGLTIGRVDDACATEPCVELLPGEPVDMGPVAEGEPFALVVSDAAASEVVVTLAVDVRTVAR